MNEPSSEIAWVERLHAVVDEVARAPAEANAARMSCKKGCADCCVDGLTVFAIEAAVIERHYPRLLAEEAPHSAGACAFLDHEGGCRIYEHRPYVCRTQGLPLRWLEEDDEGTFEARDICPKNVDGGPPLEDLAAGDCWTIGPFEQRLAERQAKNDGGRGERVALRGLFVSAEPDGRRRLPVVPGA